ncbi:MAG: ribose-5-phosphate isomerase [Candidatus Zambryskibacteria bacterium RIFCSPLOWO2_02_FULL_51_21]|uniref:Ribose-5-phosphate isomerase n=1 Tax=Candidatus Zambryskibacteria bacterium RIFCSPHIGHO2_02_FULL_43_37 TaxID=1802749 RepID=A0A1G2THT4_9BACT|nr:MAG: ribose-5-phosphate isomerase [Candidatus Zambryskibacteria bacterium RIFCSPHIGHO2_01_FULL_52_18]OHA96762.1 MAG: ribose-5-phosphate isomerase [Candidatus Zambryskibacteria bacterium RIFCSPHIGHO2_02_FULL_43_37]OHB07455.1 MAG: ribose-5-phosphate isomerase [Candidatus Zambryskibacteria bacterium RIFCSPLOWO2_01_FULL_52_12]OHB11118.1 MAG: ribose-5-phosphate isomerase [Candidatus Zambryskibacteria bacterium RIFCSPLOWO2_02_FULL_51_21]
MKIFIGGDHAGFELKGKVVEFLKNAGHEVVDKGPLSFDPADDYPDFIKSVAEAVAQDAGAKGVVIGKSGQGEAVCANRVKGARAAVYYGGSMEIVRLSREHNDANILSLGAGFLGEREALEAVETWLATPFSGEERHTRRIEKLDI